MKTKKAEPIQKLRGRMPPPTSTTGNLNSRPKTRSIAGQFDPSPRNSAKTSAAAGSSNSKKRSVSPKSQTTDTYVPRISKARKALFLSTDIGTLTHTKPSTSATTSTSTFQTDRVPPLSTHSWNNPSLPRHDTHTMRRSQRLVLKQDHCPEPQTGNGSASQDLLGGADLVSIHSDYGTASEASFCMRKRGKRKNENELSPMSEIESRTKRIKISRSDNIEDLSASQGYESESDDLEDNLSDLMLHDLDPTIVPGRLNPAPWDSDDELHPADEKVAQINRHIVEWSNNCEVPVPEGDGSKVEVELVSDRDNSIHCLIPKEGYKFPPDVYEKERERESGRSGRRRTRFTYPTDEFYSDPHHPFKIQTWRNVEVEGNFRKKGLRILSASPVISLEPIGTKFSKAYPAFVLISLEMYPAEGDEIYLLVSKTSPDQGEEFKWFVQPNITTALDEFDNNRMTVSFETHEFCYFTIVIREKRLMATKQIRSRIGGRLVVPDSMIEIYFPRGSVAEDIIAKVRVHMDTELSLPDYLEDGNGSLGEVSRSLASPILLLEPHGMDFSPEGVTIQLPIPDYDIITQRFGSQARLTIWESQTDENEVPDWKLLDVPFTVSRVKQMTVISFKVLHFSFFRAVWDLISSSLYDAKVGVSYFYPFLSFAMKCQANMEENKERNTFGLEVICYRSDKMLPMPELTNYVHRVGACSHPKLVRPGKIIVRLKTMFFEADVEAGEDPSLEKEEADFRGRDFEMQYACKFKKDAKIDKGTFGKVIVKRFVKQGNEEALFEFNLQKSGHEGEATPHERSDRWSIVALKQLATNLFLTDGDNWKLFAKEIGLTKREMKSNLKNCPDPFVTMIQMYQQRGGTPDEFVRCLYCAHRELKNINAGLSPASTASSSSSSGRGSLPADYLRGVGHASDSDTTGTQISQDSVLSGMRKRSNPSINRSGGSSSKDKYKSAKRRRISKLAALPIRSSQSADNEHSTTSSSESDSEDDEGPPPGSAAGPSSAKSDTSHLERNDMMKLNPSFLWELSSSMDVLNWRALGRSLGLEEPILLNIEHSYKTSGFRECAYQTLLQWQEKFPKKSTFGVLYTALRKENMNAVAKKMKTITKNE